QKRNYCEIRETTSVIDTPQTKHHQKGVTTDDHQRLLKYVETFRDLKTNRMDWKKYYAQAVKDKITMVTVYKDVESLRTMCAKFKRKT
ncbi:hypothetical protein BDC45DRAFT_436025, partial [Circinella umbellata]